MTNTNNAAAFFFCSITSSKTSGSCQWTRPYWSHHMSVMVMLLMTQQRPWTGSHGPLLRSSADHTDLQWQTNAQGTDQSVEDKQSSGGRGSGKIIWQETDSSLLRLEHIYRRRRQTDVDEAVNESVRSNPNWTKGHLGLDVKKETYVSLFHVKCNFFTWFLILLYFTLF